MSNLCFHGLATANGWVSGSGGHIARNCRNNTKRLLWFYFQLIGEIIFLVTASVSGLYYRIMSDAAHKRTVDGTRVGIEQRVKLECEREQQEQLLLSVIPAYIAAEVRHRLK